MSRNNHRRLTTVVILVACFGSAGAIALLIHQHWQASVDASKRSSQFPPIGPDNPPSPESFHPERVVSQQPVVSGFRVVHAEDAKQKVKDSEIVLGVVLDGQARAYPLNMLTGPQREVINDRLADRAIAVTW